ncbi:MAG TPA: hypothetical protein VHH53_12240, partial [Pseudonocardiaceae bacterium]|nr:hypothetical protein [Pseudonocardiaceae bacterium]
DLDRRHLWQACETFATRHRRFGTATATVPLDALVRGDWQVADAAPAAACREGSGLVAAHLQWHLERQLRSLPLVERATPASPHSAGSAGLSGGQ